MYAAPAACTKALSRSLPPQSPHRPRQIARYSPTVWGRRHCAFPPLRKAKGRGTARSAVEGRNARGGSHTLDRQTHPPWRYAPVPPRWGDIARLEPSRTNNATPPLGGGEAIARSAMPEGGGTL